MQQYIRFLVPLTSESKGYEYRGKSPAGRCLLESRAGMGKLILWVQDLKPEVMYRVHLIFKSGSLYAGLPLCQLVVRPHGKAELRHTFNASDIEGYGKSLDDCLAVAVMADGVAPLCGYLADTLPWRSGFRKLEKDLHLGPVPEPMPEEPEEPQEAQVPQESEESEPAPVEEEPEPPEEPENYDPLPGDPENSLSEDFKWEVDVILRSHTHMYPFHKQNRHVEWVRISLNEDLSLPNYICDLLSEPFVESAYKQYNHLILGKAEDDGPERYYIGVPSLYDPKDKIIGFRQFKCSEDKEPKPGDYGYWLIFMS